MRLLRNSLLILLAILIAALISLWTPNTDYQDSLKKYAGEQPQFITLEGGLRVHFRDTGNKTGPTILMIHGTSDSLLTWEPISDYLQSRFRLISIDLPGHGFSSAAESISFTMLVDAAHQTLVSRGVKSAIWMGNSLGGGVAWRAALRHPQAVEALILLNSSGAPRASRSRSNIGFRILANPVGRFIGRNITPRALIEKSLLGSVNNHELLTDSLVDRYWELLRLPGNREALANLATMPRSDSDWNNIGGLTVPTLIVWGDADQIIPMTQGNKFLDAISGSEFISYADIGHLPMIEAPERLSNDIVRFVEQHLSTPSQP